MKTVTSTFKNNIKSYGRQLDVIITYGNTTLTRSEINEITPQFDTDILKSAMKGMNVDCNVQIPIGTEFNVQAGVKLGDNPFEYLDFGNYIVKENEYDPNLKAYVIKAYDKMLYSMKNYEGIDITYPCTVRDYITALCDKIGLVFANEDDEFCNYDKIVKSDYFDDTYTYRDILDQIAQITGSIVCLNANDEVEIRYPNETNEIIDIHVLKDNNIKIGKKYGPVNSIVLSRSSDTDFIYKKDNTSIRTDGLTELKIKDNLFMNDNDRDLFLNELADELFGMTYYVCDLETTGLWYMEIADVFNIYLENRELIYPSDNLYPSNDLYPVGQLYKTMLINDNVSIGHGTSERMLIEEPVVDVSDYSKTTESDKIQRETGIIVDKKISEIDITADKIHLEGYTTINEGFSIDEIGNATMKSATLTDGVLTVGTQEIFNTSGVLSLFQYQCSGGEQNIGWLEEYSGQSTYYTKKGLQILYNIPSNFTITKAYVVFTHIPCRNEINNSGYTSYYDGYARNVELYTLNDFNSLKYDRYGWNGLPNYSSLPKTVVPNAMGSGGFTGLPNKSTTYETDDIKQYLTQGSTQMLLLDTSQGTPISQADSLYKTAMATATLFVIGYYKLS